MRRRAGIVLALLLVLTGCTPAEPAGPAAEPAAELFPPQAARDRVMATAMTIASSFFMGE